MTGLCFGSFEEVGGAGRAVGARGQVVEVAAGEFEGDTLLIDFVGGANAETAKQSQRRAPALNGVLQEESTDHGGKDQ